MALVPHCQQHNNENVQVPNKSLGALGLGRTKLLYAPILQSQNFFFNPMSLKI